MFYLAVALPFLAAGVVLWRWPFMEGTTLAKLVVAVVVFVLLVPGGCFGAAGLASMAGLLLPDH